MRRQQQRVLVRTLELEAEIKRRNWLKKEFARLCGMEPSMLSDYLRHRNAPTPEMREKMMRVLGMSWDALFFLETISTREKKMPNVELSV